MTGPGAGGDANSRCPRCGGPFRCGVTDAGPCACTTLSLPPALLAGLTQRYTGCLCLACLRSLAAGTVAAAPAAAGPVPAP